MVMFWPILPIVAFDSAIMSRDIADPAVQDRRIGRLQRDVGAAAHGDADIGGRERRRVVDAVADLGDNLAAAPAARATIRCLSCGSSSARDLDAELVADGLRRARVVAGQHDGADALGPAALRGRPPHPAAARRAWRCSPATAPFATSTETVLPSSLSASMLRAAAPRPERQRARPPPGRAEEQRLRRRPCR